MNKRVNKLHLGNLALCKQHVKSYWTLYAMTGLCTLTFTAVIARIAHADGSAWTLPYSGTSNGATTIFSITNSGNGNAVYGQGDNGAGVLGVSASGYGVQGNSTNIGVIG